MPALSTPNEAASGRDDPVVTWHVIVWVLLTLALNSMAQPSGHFCYLSLPKRYRIFLCLSPLVCLTDAISILTSVLITKFTLRRSFVVAARYVWFWRERFDEKTDADNDETFELWTLSRCIVFVIGTLPAFVKLSSFSGLPWSKTWGSMFALSFIVVEVVNLVAMRGPDGRPRSEAAALRLSADRWEADVNRSVRQKVQNVNTIVLFITLLLVMVVLWGQIALMVWPMADLLRSSIDGWFGTSDEIIIVHAYVGTITDWLATAHLVVVGLVKLVNLRYRLLPWLSWSRIVIQQITIGMVSAVFYLDPRIREQKQDEAAAMRSFWLAVVGVSAGICGLIYWFLLLVCLRLPRVGRALQIIPPVRGAAGDREEPDDKGDIVSANKIDPVGLYCATGFCFQLCVGIFWYAHRYDPTGTLNPSWTNVFG